MKHPPLVSVVIPFYNCPYVGEAIESVLFQTYPNIEIVVVDDGSTRYAAALQPYRRQIRLVRKANGGTASALNAGIRHAHGEYIAWLSADDLYYTRKFAKQIPWMMRHRLPFSFTNFDLYILPQHIVRAKIMKPVRSRRDLYRRLLSNAWLTAARRCSGGTCLSASACSMSRCRTPMITTCGCASRWPACRCPIWRNR